MDELAINFIENPTEKNFEILMNSVNWGLRTFMFKLLHDEFAVDDCMSRTMEHVYFRRDSFDTKKGKFSTWIYKIAYNNCLKYINNEFEYKMPDDVVPMDFSDIYESSLNNQDSVRTKAINTGFMEMFDIVYDKGIYNTYYNNQIINDIYDASISCLNKLPKNLKMVMKERYINKKKVKDIASDNKISIASVKNWIRRGTFVLNKELKEYVPELYKLYAELKIGEK